MSRAARSRQCLPAGLGAAQRGREARPPRAQAGQAGACSPACPPATHHRYRRRKLITPLRPLLQTLLSILCSRLCHRVRGRQTGGAAQHPHRSSLPAAAPAGGGRPGRWSSCSGLAPLLVGRRGECVFVHVHSRTHTYSSCSPSNVVCPFGLFLAGRRWRPSAAGSHRRPGARRGRIGRCRRLRLSRQPDEKGERNSCTAGKHDDPERAAAGAQCLSG